MEKESFLLEVCRYVVLNPVRSRGVRSASPEGWPWSSYRATAGLELSSYLPLDMIESRAERDEAIFQAYVEGRFSQREIGRHVGLHYVTVSGIVRAKERERRERKVGSARATRY